MQKKRARDAEDVEGHGAGAGGAAAALAPLLGLFGGLQRASRARATARLRTAERTLSRDAPPPTAQHEHVGWLRSSSTRPQRATAPPPSSQLSVASLPPPSSPFTPRDATH